jgi:hypothetical protein
MPQPKQYPDKHRKTTGNNRQNLLKNKDVFSFKKPIPQQGSNTVLVHIIRIDTLQAQKNPGQ